MTVITRWKTSAFPRMSRFACIAIAMGVAASARGELVAQYTFNSGTASAGETPFADEKTDDSLNIDPVLTLVDPTGIGGITGGQADLTANNGLGSAQDWVGGNATGVYLDLENFAIADTAFFGGNRALSIEMWVTVQENRNWARLWDIGSSSGGEDVSNGAVGQAYMIGVAQAGRGDVNGVTNPAGASTRDNSEGNPELWVPPADQTQVPPLATGVQHHIVYTLDHEDNATNANGTARLYVNNTLVGEGPVSPQFDVTADPNSGGTSELNDVNSWFGRAQFGDPLFDGYYNEIRLYSHALTSSEVNTNFLEGPVALPVPEINIDRLTGEVSIINPPDSGGDLTLVDYTLTSEEGAFIPSGFMPIDAGATSTEFELSEQGISSGGMIVVGDSISLGNALLPSRFENVEAFVELSDGTQTAVVVNFVGNDGQPLSPLDLNTDGTVDEGDFEEFASHAYTDISGMTLVEQARRGDLDGDGDNDFYDFFQFKRQFNALNGAGALEAIIAGGGTAVPEPGTLALCGIAACGVLALRRRP